MTGIPLVRTGDARLYRRINAVLDESDEHTLDKIDALIACACLLIDTLDPQAREDYAARCAVLVRRRALRFAAND
jgi:hypothetical protein